MINQANTGFMLLAASLVMLMTPGLAFFYGRLVGRPHTLPIMILAFPSLGTTPVVGGPVGRGTGCGCMYSEMAKRMNSIPSEKAS